MEQRGNFSREEDNPMVDIVKTALHRQSGPRLWQDTVGGLALAVILIVGLHLPGII